MLWFIFNLCYLYIVSLPLFCFLNCVYFIPSFYLPEHCFLNLFHLNFCHVSTFLCNFENSIINLWNNQNLKHKCLTVIWSVDRLSIAVTTRTLYTGYWLNWPREASVQRCEKTFHPHKPSARTVLVAVTAQEQGAFLCPAVNSMPIQLPL